MIREKISTPCSVLDSFNSSIFHDFFPQTMINMYEYINGFNRGNTPFPFSMKGIQNIYANKLLEEYLTSHLHNDW